MNSMTRSALARHLGVSRTTLWNYERRGQIPAATPISPNQSRFSPAAIMSAESAVRAARGKF